MKENITYSDTWWLVVNMIEVASWVPYRDLAPKTWREWLSAGVVQVFIVALYVEMYVFRTPFTCLHVFFGLDRYDFNASPWSSLVGGHNEKKGRRHD